MEPTKKFNLLGAKGLFEAWLIEEIFEPVEDYIPAEPDDYYGFVISIRWDGQIGEFEKKKFKAKYRGLIGSLKAQNRKPKPAKDHDWKALFGHVRESRTEPGEIISYRNPVFLRDGTLVIHRYNYFDDEEIHRFTFQVYPICADVVK